MNNMSIIGDLLTQFTNVMSSIGTGNLCSLLAMHKKDEVLGFIKSSKGLSRPHADSIRRAVRLYYPENTAVQQEIDTVLTKVTI